MAWLNSCVRQRLVASPATQIFGNCAAGKLGRKSLLQEIPSIPDSPPHAGLPRLSLLTWSSGKQGPGPQWDVHPSFLTASHWLFLELLSSCKPGSLGWKLHVRALCGLKIHWELAPFPHPKGCQCCSILSACCTLRWFLYLFGGYSSWRLKEEMAEGKFQAGGSFSWFPEPGGATQDSSGVTGGSKSHFPGLLPLPTVAS